jgi:radical SAM protein with 4Fe4S-binding SPASM domain
MDFNLFKNVIDDMAKSKWRVKMLRFAAIGEPLLHPQIADMVAYAIKMNIADTVDIVTNASLLTEELSDKLIRAKLSTLRVSLEGLSAHDYAETSKANVDFEKLCENIRYFYENSKKNRVYVKIVDYMLRDDEERKKLFIDTFGPISHSVQIEHLTPTVDGIDYQKIAGEQHNFSTAQGGNPIRDIRICPQPFYMIQVNPDGNIVPCCSMKYPGTFGNVTQTKLSELWNGNALMSFRRAMLSGAENTSEVCAACLLYKYGIFDEDILDGHEVSIIERQSLL